MLKLLNYLTSESEGLGSLKKVLRVDERRDDQNMSSCNL